MINKTLLNETVVPLLKKVLDVSLLQQKVIANNIANVDTPGYVARKLNNEKAFRYIFDQSKKDLAEKDEMKLAEIVEDQSRETMNGINNVDIEKEMAHLAENQILYQTTTKFIQNKIKALKISITGRTV